MRAESEEGNALITKLRQQSLDNKEKNELMVQRKTFENDQVRWSVVVVVEAWKGRSHRNCSSRLPLDRLIDKCLS